jgi:hypothetical protein
MRVRFRKGQQRKFFLEVIRNSGCPSLRGLIDRGFDIPYSTLKSYFNENRTIPQDLFESLRVLGSIPLEKYKISLFEDNWGNVIGGRN